MENHSVDERSMRGVFSGSRAGTKLVLCHHHALLHSRLQFHTPAVACGRGVLWHDDLPSLSARIAWKGAFLYNALECAHLFTIQGRALQGGAVASPRTQAPPSEARASSETVRMPRWDTV